MKLNHFRLAGGAFECNSREQNMTFISAGNIQMKIKLFFGQKFGEI
jgi:hypothetical protein